MAGQMNDAVKHSLKAAEGLYYRLVLLVGKAGSGKTPILQGIAKELGTSVINVNLEISSELLELTARQRSLRLPEIFTQIVAKAQSPVILDNLEILFDKNLMQDPLRLLQNISRNRVVVASWNGIMVHDKLQYAEIGHPECKGYESVDALIVDMNTATSIEFDKNYLEAGQA